MKLYFEYIAYLLIRNILKLFSFNAASSIGGFLLKNLGKYSKYKDIISSNVSLLKLNTSRITNENLDQTGRVFFEFFNLSKFNWKNIIVKNQDYLDLIQRYKGSKIFISAHIGNWEITRNYLLNKGFVLHSIYRQANNRMIDSYIQKNRQRENAFFYKKGSDSAKNMIKVLKNRGDLALLVDQRDSSGPLINFFNKKAYASEGFANLALKYQTMICPVYSIRNKNGSFQLIFEKPLEFNEYQNLTPKDLVQKVYIEYFESWIIKNPEQWLWSHERWKI
jgi:KDO2-lipid IV(A) lauroyltransferase